jgi:hypothetical protein
LSALESGRGAEDLGPLFSPEEEQVWQNLTKWYGEVSDTSKGFWPGMNQAVERALSGRPSTEIDEKATQEFFSKSIEAPMVREWSKTILPQIQRAYSGFTSRESDAIGRSANELMGNLASEYGKIRYADEQQRRELAELALNRQLQGVGMATSLMGLPSAFASSFGALAGARTEAQRQEKERLAWYKNPAIGLGMQFMGMPQTTWINEPPRMTGFGTALTGMNAVFQTAGNFMSIFRGGGTQTNPGNPGGGGGGGGGGAPGMMSNIAALYR